METTGRVCLTTCCLISSADISKKDTAHNPATQGLSSLQLHQTVVTQPKCHGCRQNRESIFNAQHSPDWSLCFCVCVHPGAYHVLFSYWKSVVLSQKNVGRLTWYLKETEAVSLGCLNTFLSSLQREYLWSAVTFPPLAYPPHQASRSGNKQLPTGRNSVCPVSNRIHTHTHQAEAWIINPDKQQ